MSYRDPPRLPVKDPEVQRAVDELRRAIIELARESRSRDMPLTLIDTVPLVVHHGLGRPALGYALSAPVGPTATGRIEEFARSADTVTFIATGFGATVAVNVRFW